MPVAEFATDGALPLPLGDDLLLRRATPADTEALAAFNGRIRGDAETEQLHGRISAWTRDLMTGEHAICAPADFTLVENTGTQTIVPSCCLTLQTWTYGSVEFGVGWPELVGTHPDDRRRELVRTQFEVLHRWSSARGHLVQASTGIPWFYRQFGNEMALELGGGRIGYRPHGRGLKDGAYERYRVRAASEADLPFICLIPS